MPTITGPAARPTSLARLLLARLLLARLLLAWLALAWLALAGSARARPMTLARRWSVPVCTRRPAPSATAAIAAASEPGCRLVPLGGTVPVAGRAGRHPGRHRGREPRLEELGAEHLGDGSWLGNLPAG